MHTVPMSDQAAAVALLVALVLLLLLWRLTWLGFRWLLRVAAGAPKRVVGSRSWARVHPIRTAMRERFPRGYAFLCRRLAPDRFEGLPLTLVLVAAAYLIALLAGIVEDILDTEEVIAADVAIDAALAPYRSTFLLVVFYWVTDFGGQSALVAVSIVATGFLWADRRSTLILPLWVVILGSETTTWLGKFGFDRDRPEFTTVATALSPSFPSGHAAGAMAVYGFVAYAIARNLDTTRQRFEVTFWTLVLVVAIAFSRVFLDVHYASDVAAGLLVGGFWLLVGFTIAELQRPSAGGRGSGPSPL